MQTLMTYLLRKLCPSLAHNQTACPGGRAGATTRLALERDDSEARYSLIVSLHVPENGVDLLTPVQLKVDALIAIQVEITS
ncbi:TPA: hypothetical protein ACG0MD_004269 [Enterobacter roggenkampii]